MQGAGVGTDMNCELGRSLGKDQEMEKEAELGIQGASGMSDGSRTEESQGWVILPNPLLSVASQLPLPHGRQCSF